MGIPLDAYLVVDNCVISMLVDFAHSSQPYKLKIPDYVANIQQWITAQFVTLRSLTPDGAIHCTDCVAQEFKPENGLVSTRYGIKGEHFRALKTCICSLLLQARGDRDEISLVKSLPGIPAKYFGKYGLSDNDLSLIVLGLNLTGSGRSVYMLSNDRDLTDFISILCNKRGTNIHAHWPNHALLTGLHCMTYLESVHAACHISTPELGAMLRFVMNEHVKRMAESYDVVAKGAGQRILNPQKAVDIFGTFTQVMTAYELSAQEKVRTKARKALA